MELMAVLYPVGQDERLLTKGPTWPHRTVLNGSLSLETNLCLSLGLEDVYLPGDLHSC